MTELQNDRMTDRTKTICPPIFDLGGIINSIIISLKVYLSLVVKRTQYQSCIMRINAIIISINVFVSITCCQKDPKGTLKDPKGLHKAC